VIVSEFFDVDKSRSILRQCRRETARRTQESERHFDTVAVGEPHRAF